MVEPSPPTILEHDPQREDEHQDREALRVNSA